MTANQRATLMAAAIMISAAPLPAYAQTGNNAQVVGSTIPGTMAPGYTFDVSVTMRNTGTSTWTRQAGHKLGQQGSSPLIAPGRIELGGNEAIAPGQERTFNFTLTAPIATGNFTISFQMVQEHVEWFGEALSPQVQVTFGSHLPLAPTITWPTAGMILGSNRPDITWATRPLDAYEVHIGSFNDPSSADGWDSGPVYLSALTNSATSAPLVPQRWYYVFVRLHNSNGWGSWSAPTRYFCVAGELVNDPYFIADPNGGQWQHAMCYNPDRNEYLIAYMDAHTGTRSVISYYRLSATGTKIGPEVSIPDNLEGCGGPKVCYNSARQEYLIAYGGWISIGGLHDELRVQRVNGATGGLIGSSNWIANTPGAFKNNVAYSPASDSYLLVWDSGYDRPCPLYATRLNSTGAPAGSVFFASTAPYVWAGNPAVCYNSVDDEFFVTFQAYYETEPLTWWDYYAQRIRTSDGSLLGSNITIALTPQDDANGDVAYDSDLNRYLVIYDGGDPTPWLQFVSASGTLQGPRFPAAPEASYNGGMSSIAWHPVTKEYLATWAHCCSYGNFARRLSQAGANIGEPFRTNGGVLGIGNWDPMAVANPVNGEYLLYWFCSYDDVYVRRYKPYPLLPPDVTPPAPASNLALFTYPSSIAVSWTNPGTPDFSATMTRVKIDSPPASAADGTFVAEVAGAPGSTGSVEHKNLISGVTYCYAAFAHDLPPNYATPATKCVKVQLADFDMDTDVDQSDFGHLQNCLGDFSLPYPPGCRNADLDEDGDVDTADLTQFTQCHTGPDQPPGC